MTDKLRAAALMAVDALDSDDPTIQLRAALNLRAALAEQEPIACVGTNGELMWLKKPEVIYSKPQPLYAAPPQRPWVGLTDDEIDEIYKAHHTQYGECKSVNFGYERAIEAKLREKNT